MLGMQTKKAVPKTGPETASPTAGTWIDREVEGCNFGMWA